MNGKTRKFAVMMSVLLCVGGVVSCGNDVPKSSEDSQGGFEVAGGENESSESDETGAISATTSADDLTATDGAVTTAEGGNVSLVTRSKEELDNLKHNKPSGNFTQTVKPSGGNTSGGNNKPSGGNTVPSGGNTVPSGGNTAGGNTTPTQNGNTGVSGITLSYYSADLMVGQTKGYPTVSETINEIWSSSDPNVATVDNIGNITAVGEGSCVIRVVSADNSSIGAEVAVTVSSAEGVQVIDGITYVSGILIANKSYGLPSTYNPGGLTGDTYSAFQELVQGAANDNINIFLSSGFRSYETQDQIYNNYVYTHGQATADTFSARPGFSEHQTGMAIDVNEISDAFIGTPEAVWLEEHCTEYGFIIRYPYGKDNITGYKYEPWHIRYVGKEVAQAVKDAAAAAGDPYLTLEEYLGIDSYYH